MADKHSPDPLVAVTKALAGMTTSDGYQYLVMHTGELVELLRASGIDPAMIDNVVRVAVSEHGAEKLAHLDNSWRREPTAD